MNFETISKLKQLEDLVTALYKHQRLPWYRRWFAKLPAAPSAEKALQAALREAIVQSGLFDSQYYASRYPDVSASGLDPLEHFITLGSKERRMPSPLFDPAKYLAANPHLDPVLTNPFQHFLLNGLQREREVIPEEKEGIELNKELVEILKKPDITETSVINKLAKIRLKSFLSKEGFTSYWTDQGNRTAEPLVSIIYILYGKAELLLPTLESLISECEVGLEVIIIDNASSDETHALLQQLEGVRSVLNEHNKGFIAAANQGGSIARGKYLLFLNNDTILQVGSVRSALKTIQANDNIGVVGGKIILLNGTLQEAGSILYSDGSTYGYGRSDDPFDPRYMYQRDVLFCSGCFYLTPRDLFLKMGGFDINYAPAYYEDVDYCLRLKEAGYRTVYDPKVELFHYEHGSSNREKVAEMMLRNRARLLERHSSLLKGLDAPGYNWEELALQAYQKVNRLLYIWDDFPEDKNKLSDLQRLQIVEGFDSLGWHVTVIQLSSDVINWNKVRKALPPKVHFYHSAKAELERLSGSEFDKIIASPEVIKGWKALDTSKPKAIIDNLSDFLAIPIYFSESPAPLSFSERDGILIATDEYSFNEIQLERLVWFLEEVYPILEKNGLRKVRVLGKLGSKFNKLRYPASIDFIDGESDRAAYFEKSRCLVVPFSTNSGANLTCREAAVAGLPMVLSDEAAQGMGWFGFSALKSSSCLNCQQFASLCIEVVQNEILWEGLSQLGLSRGREECSQERFLSLLRQAVGSQAH